MTTHLSDIFHFEIDERVIDNLEFLNEVLESLNAPPITENPDFTFDKDSSGTNGININVKSYRNTNSVEMWLQVECDGLRLDLDGIDETFEWTNKHIEDSREATADFIRHIFTGHILIETRRGSRFIQIFDSEGIFFDSFSRNNLLHMVTGSYLWRKDTFRHLFFPFLSDKE